MTTIEIKLYVYPGNRIIVPGTESNSQTTTSVLYQELKKVGITMPSIVTVEQVLEAIPGSKLVIIDNFGQNARFIVLPPAEVNCPNSCPIDYYKILIDLAKEATPEEISEMGIVCASFQNYGCLNGS